MTPSPVRQQVLTSLSTKVDNSGANLTYDRVKVNDPSDIQTATMTTGIAKFNFVVSYVKESNAVPVTSGYVKSNAAYTITYE